MKMNRLKSTSAPDAEASPSRSQLESDLIKVTDEIAKAHKEEQAAKKIKETKRAEFFRLADLALTADGLERQIVDLPDYVGHQSEMDDTDPDIHFRFTPQEWVARCYPGWIIMERTGDDKLVLEQDVTALPFTYVNNVSGVVLSRSVSMVKSGIDTDWLAQEWPEVAARVTHKETITVFDEDQAVLYLNEKPESQAIFEKVAYLGTPQPKLLAPSKVKEEND